MARELSSSILIMPNNVLYKKNYVKLSLMYSLRRKGSLTWERIVDVVRQTRVEYANV